MSEEMKIKLLPDVASMKTAFWVAVSEKVWEGATGPEREEWNDVIRKGVTKGHTFSATAW